MALVVDWLGIGVCELARDLDPFAFRSMVFGQGYVVFCPFSVFSHCWFVG